MEPEAASQDLRTPTRTTSLPAIQDALTITAELDSLLEEDADLDTEVPAEALALRTAFVAYCRGHDWRPQPPPHSGTSQSSSLRPAAISSSGAASISGGLYASPSTQSLTAAGATAASVADAAAGTGMGLNNWMRLWADLGLLEGQGGPLAGTVLQTIHAAYRPHNSARMTYLGFVLACAAISSQLRQSLVGLVGRHGAALLAAQRHQWRLHLVQQQLQQQAHPSRLSRPLRASLTDDEDELFESKLELSPGDIAKEIAVLWQLQAQLSQQQPQNAGGDANGWIPREPPPVPPSLSVSGDVFVRSQAAPLGGFPGGRVSGGGGPKLPNASPQGTGRGCGIVVGSDGRSTQGKGAKALGGWVARSGGGGDLAAATTLAPAPLATNPYLQGLPRSKHNAPQLRPLRGPGAGEGADLRGYQDSSPGRGPRPRDPGVGEALPPFGGAVLADDPDPASSPLDATMGRVGRGRGADPDQVYPITSGPPAIGSPLTGSAAAAVAGDRRGAVTSTSAPVGSREAPSGSGDASTVKLPAVAGASRRALETCGGPGEGLARLPPPPLQSDALESGSPTTAASLTATFNRQVSYLRATAGGIASLGVDPAAAAAFRAGGVSGPAMSAAALDGPLQGRGGEMSEAGQALVAALLARVERLEKAAVSAESKLAHVGSRVRSLERAGEEGATQASNGGRGVVASEMVTALAEAAVESQTRRLQDELAVVVQELDGRQAFLGRQILDHQQRVAEQLQQQAAALAAAMATMRAAEAAAAAVREEAAAAHAEAAAAAAAVQEATAAAAQSAAVAEVAMKASAEAVAVAQDAAAQARAAGESSAKALPSPEELQTAAIAAATESAGQMLNAIKAELDKQVCELAERQKMLDEQFAALATQQQHLLEQAATAATEASTAVEAVAAATANVAIVKAAAAAQEKPVPGGSGGGGESHCAQAGELRILLDRLQAELNELRAERDAKSMPSAAASFAATEASPAAADSTPTADTLSAAAAAAAAAAQTAEGELTTCGACCDCGCTACVAAMGLQEAVDGCRRQLDEQSAAFDERLTAAACEAAAAREALELQLQDQAAGLQALVSELQARVSELSPQVQDTPPRAKVPATVSDGSNGGCSGDAKREGAVGGPAVTAVELLEGDVSRVTSALAVEAAATTPVAGDSPPSTNAGTEAAMEEAKGKAAAAAPPPLEAAVARLYEHFDELQRRLDEQLLLLAQSKVASEGAQEDGEASGDTRRGRLPSPGTPQTSRRGIPASGGGNTAAADRPPARCTSSGNTSGGGLVPVHEGPEGSGLAAAMEAAADAPPTAAQEPAAAAGADPEVDPRLLTTAVDSAVQSGSSTAAPLGTDTTGTAVRPSSSPAPPPAQQEQLQALSAEMSSLRDRVESLEQAAGAASVTTPAATTTVAAIPTEEVMSAVQRRLDNLTAEVRQSLDLTSAAISRDLDAARIELAVMVSKEVGAQMAATVAKTAGESPPLAVQRQQEQQQLQRQPLSMNGRDGGGGGGDGSIIRALQERLTSMEAEVADAGREIADVCRAADMTTESVELLTKHLQSLELGQREIEQQLADVRQQLATGSVFAAATPAAASLDSDATAAPRKQPLLAPDNAFGAATTRDPDADADFAAALTELRSQLMEMQAHNLPARLQAAEATLRNANIAGPAAVAPAAASSPGASAVAAVPPASEATPAADGAPGAPPAAVQPPPSTLPLPPSSAADVPVAVSSLPGELQVLLLELSGQVDSLAGLLREQEHGLDVLAQVAEAASNNSRGAASRLDVVEASLAALEAAVRAGATTTPPPTSDGSPLLPPPVLSMRTSPSSRHGVSFGAETVLEDTKAAISELEGRLAEVEKGMEVRGAAMAALSRQLDESSRRLEALDGRVTDVAMDAAAAKAAATASSSTAAVGDLSASPTVVQDRRTGGGGGGGEYEESPDSYGSNEISSSSSSSAVSSPLDVVKLEQEWQARLKAVVKLLEGKVQAGRDRAVQDTGELKREMARLREKSVLIDEVILKLARRLDNLHKKVYDVLDTEEAETMTTYSVIDRDRLGPAGGTSRRTGPGPGGGAGLGRQLTRSDSQESDYQAGVETPVDAPSSRVASRANSMRGR